MKRTAAAFVVLLSCQRAPEEPLSRPTATVSAPGSSTVTLASPATTATTGVPATTSTTTSSVPTDGGRCIAMTPVSARPAPPPPAAAGLCPPDDLGAAPDAGKASYPLAFPDAPGAKAQVELASTASDIQRGLMYRTKMAEDRGMLFQMRERKEQVFWMRNTCLPLDMLFIDEDGTIVGIVENVPTLNDEERTVGCPSSYVLEMNAGWSKRHGVKPGQKISIPAAARAK